MVNYFLFKGKLSFCQELTKLSLEGKKYSHTINFNGGRLGTNTSKKQEIPVYVLKSQRVDDISYVSYTQSISTITSHYRLSAKGTQKISIYRFYKLLKENSSKANSKSLNYTFDVLAILKKIDFSLVEGWLIVFPKDNHQDISFRIYSEDLSYRILSQTSFVYNCVEKGNVPPFFLPYVVLRGYCKQLCSDQKPLTIKQKQKILSRFNIEYF